MAAPTKSNVLLLLFPGFNTLDVNGPLEVFRKSGSSNIFDVTIVSETECTTSVEGAIMKVCFTLFLINCDYSLTLRQRHKALDSELIASLSSYDLLIVPGGYATGAESPVQSLANNVSSPYMELIARFAQLPPRSEQFPRILL
jgi:putative intracellular protease/amidase